MDDSTLQVAASIFASAAEPRWCTKCKSPAIAGYKKCSRCLEKRAAEKRRSAALKRQVKQDILAASMKSNVHPFSSSSQYSGKRKALEESVADVMERNRKRVRMIKLAKDDASSETSSADAAESVFQKFVTASDLHKDLKSRSQNNSHSLSFDGTYAIIAFPDVDNRDRARQVARDLKDNTPLNFNLEDVSKHRSSDADKTYTVSYKCTCHTRPLKRSSSNLLAYFSSKSSSKNTLQSECQGLIVIRVSDDTSHSLGWLGQRVKVTVSHPTV